MPRNALGRGLGALIREPEPQVPVRPAEDAAVANCRKRADLRWISGCGSSCDESGTSRTAAD